MAHLLKWNLELCEGKDEICKCLHCVLGLSVSWPWQSLSIRKAPWFNMFLFVGTVSQTKTMNYIFHKYKSVNLPSHYQVSNSPEVRGAVTQDDLVDRKFNILHFDDCITKLSLQTEFIIHWARLVWRLAFFTHLEFCDCFS